MGMLDRLLGDLVAAALADGELEPAERDSIFAHLESGELAPSEVQQVRRDLVLPATPDELAAMVSEPEDRELLYRFAFLTLRADGELEPHEAAWVARLGGALGLDAERRGAVEREILGG